MVLRVPWGGGIRAPEHHSEANEAIFTNVPGLRVVLLAGKKLRTSKSKLVLVGLRDMVREVFDMSGFLSLFAVTATLDEGLAKV